MQKCHLHTKVWKTQGFWAKPPPLCPSLIAGGGETTSTTTRSRKHLARARREWHAVPEFVLDFPRAPGIRAADHGVTRPSPLLRLMLCTCLRTSFCNSGCGRRPLRRTKRRGRHRTHGCSRSIFPSASAITIACIGCSISTCNKAATARRKPCSLRCDKASPSSPKMTRAT